MDKAVADRLPWDYRADEHRFLPLVGAAMTDNGRVLRLRRWLLVLTIVVLTGAVTAPIIGAAIVDRREAGTQLVIACTSARSNITQLEALRAFSRRLGVPWTYPIPEVPPECAGY